MRRTTTTIFHRVFLVNLLNLLFFETAILTRFWSLILGGSLFNILVRGLPSAIKSKEAQGISINSWHIFLCDERLVPLSDSDSNAAPYLKLFSELGHPSERFHLVKTSLERIILLKFLP